MRAAKINPRDPWRVKLYHVMVWHSPDGGGRAVLRTPAGDMVGEEALQEVCVQLEADYDLLQASRQGSDTPYVLCGRELPHDVMVAVTGDLETEPW